MEEPRLAQRHVVRCAHLLALHYGAGIAIVLNSLIMAMYLTANNSRMFRVVLLAISLFCALPLAAQEGYTKGMAAKMLAEMVTNGETVVMDREVQVGGEYTDFTFTASSSASGYNVALVFPYSPGYTNFEGYVTYGDEAKRLPFKYTPGSSFKKGNQIGYLFLKIASKPGHTAHLRFIDRSEMPGTLCRLMVVEYR